MEAALKILIFGLGYVGCTAAACITKQGHHVVGIDVAQDKVDIINAGQSPIEEPGLGDLIKAARDEGLLEARTSIGDALDDADVAIVCVGTPSAADGAHDMRYIISVTNDIARALDDDRAKVLTIAYRSTMRPGTMEDLVGPVIEGALSYSAKSNVELVYNPEFLRESSAIQDYFEPPKIVIGTHDGGPSQNMDALHDGIDAPIFHVKYREAEITKFVDNTWHAVKVGFANEIGRICQKQNIDPRTVHDIFKSDTKLNLSAYYTRPGGPFGGSCLPKDVRALQYMSSDLGANTPMIDMLMRSNDAHKHFQADRVKALLPEGGKILLAGLAFKADTDDLRESPNVDLARKLLEAGYELAIFDPAIAAEKLVGQNLGYAYSNLPSLRQLLISKDDVQNGKFDLVIKANRTFDQLDLADTQVIDLDSMD